MKFSDIILVVKQKGDGRDFTTDENKGWINAIRTEIAMNPIIAGFRGLFFLYKESTVLNGSEKDQPRYAMPSDFIDDLNVFYDGVLLSKAPAGMTDIVAASEDMPATPTWLNIRGTEFEILPAPPDDGKEIKLLYNGLPTAVNDLDYEDYFMKHFPLLHIYGMAEQMAERIGQDDLATKYGTKYIDQQKVLMLHNRRHYFFNARLRFSTWDEYLKMRTIVFPQFSGENL
jgi:hypothetical protein